MEYCRVSVCTHAHECRDLVPCSFQSIKRDTCTYIAHARLCVCMYVCVYVCMYVRMYVCMYVCMYICTSMYECMYFIYERMNVCVCMYAYMYVCVYVCMHACMRVYMYICMCECMFVVSTVTRLITITKTSQII